MRDERPRQHSALDARDDMLAIVYAWPDLLTRLGRDGSAGGEKVSGSRSPGLVINERVSDTMAAVRDWAAFLARVLLQETDWTPPRVQDTPALLHNIARTRIGHFTEHEDEGMRLAFFDDVDHHRRAVESAAYPRGVKIIPVHVECVEHTTTDLGERVPCPGEYTVRLDPERAGLIPDMICDHDRAHRITPEQWQRAARKTGFDPTAMRQLLAGQVAP